MQVRLPSTVVADTLRRIVAGPGRGRSRTRPAISHRARRPVRRRGSQIGDHPRRHLERFVMRTLVRRHGAFGNRCEGRVWIRRAGRPRRESSAAPPRGRSPGTRLISPSGDLDDQLHQQAEGDLLAVQSIVGARDGGEAVVYGVGQRQPAGLESEPRQQCVGLDHSLQRRSHGPTSTARIAAGPSANSVWQHSPPGRRRSW